MIWGTNMRLRTWHLGPFPVIHTSNRIAISVKKVDPETSVFLYSNLPGWEEPWSSWCSGMTSGQGKRSPALYSTIPVLVSGESNCSGKLVKTTSHRRRPRPECARSLRSLCTPGLFGRPIHLYQCYSRIFHLCLPCMEKVCIDCQKCYNWKSLGGWTGPIPVDQHPLPGIWRILYRRVRLLWHKYGSKNVVN